MNIAFTVNGSATLGYAQKFANAVNPFLQGGGSTINIDNPTTPGAFGRIGAPGGINVVPVYTFNNGNDTVTIPGSGGYTLDTVGGGVTVQGSTGGTDSLLVVAVNAATTYLAEGSNNTVTFVAGDNLYDGTANTVGGDTVVTGSGQDTVNTGVGATTVFSGTGHSTIYLNDTATGAFNDKVWLLDGLSTVTAAGMSDFVGTTQSGQMILDTNTVDSSSFGVLLSATESGAAGNNVVVAGAGTSSVYDYSSGNSIFGGSGLLYVIAGAGTSSSVVAGTGAAYIFGDSGANVAFSNAAGDTAPAYYVAGAGAETFFGGNGSTNEYIYGYTAGDSASAAAVSESLVGGSGNDLLVSGSGNETLTGGAGNNTFLINYDSVNGSNVVLSDFSTGNNVVEFANVSQADLQTAIQNGTAGTFNGAVDYTITLGDNTQVTFVGINSASELNGKLG